MRRITIAVVVAVLFALPGAAQQQNSGPVRLSVFVSNVGYTESDSAGSNLTGAVGAALEYRVTPQWSAALSVTAQESTRHFDPPPPDVFNTVWISRMDVRSYPVDLVAQYHIANRSKWQPYVGAGARWVSGPSAPEKFDNRLSAQAAAGVDWNFASAWSMRIDAKRLLRTDAAFYDELTKVSIGMGWRF
jgi:outer membrane protein W